MELETLSLIWEQKTKYQTMRFYEDKENKLWFTLDTYCQFVEGEDEEIYHKALTNSAIEMNFLAEEFLILGGGDGLVARNILRFNPFVNITLIEIDEEVIKAFMQIPRLVRLNEHSLFGCNVVIQDALNWVPKCDKKYDIIILDFPDSNSEALKKLYTEEFLTKVVKLLNKNGIISIQCHENITDKISKIITELLKNSRTIKYEMPNLGNSTIVLGQKI